MYAIKFEFSYQMNVLVYWSIHVYVGHDLCSLFPSLSLHIKFEINEILLSTDDRAHFIFENFGITLQYSASE